MNPLDAIYQELEIVYSQIQELQNAKNSNSNISQNTFLLHRPVTESDNSAIKSVLDFPVSVMLEGTQAATASNYGIFFIADRPCEVTSVRIRYSVASTSGTLQIEKLNGTKALDAGDTILTFAISMSATANTTYTGTLVSTVSRTLYPGDALALKDAGVLTGLSGLSVTITVKYK